MRIEASQQGLGRMAVEVLAGALAVAFPVRARGQTLNDRVPEDAQGLEIVEHLGETVPMDVRLVDDRGREVVLGDYFGQSRPVVLVMAYYECPMLCGRILDTLFSAFDELDYRLGRDFTLVVVSFDPDNTTEQAAEWKLEHLWNYRPVRRARAQAKAEGRTWEGIDPSLADGAAFHTAEAADAQRLADAVGFPYRFQPEFDTYAHPASVQVLSPDGVVSGYLHGLSYATKQVRVALLEASQGRIAGSLTDRVLLFCYRYDPESGSYTVQAMAIMRLGGALTVLLLGGLIGMLFLNSRRRGRRRAAEGEQGAGPQS